MEQDKFQELLGLVSVASGTSEEVRKNVEAIKDIVSDRRLRDRRLLGTLVNQLLIEVSSLHSTNDQLQKKLADFGKHFAERDQFEREKARYEMVETEEGDFVFRIKNHMADEEPVHYICPVCLNQGKTISLLAGRNRKHCQTNRKHVFNFGKNPPKVQSRVRH